MRQEGVAEIVRLADPAVADDLVEALRAAGAEAERKDARTILVTGGDEDLQTELAFFVRAWARSRPVEFVVESAQRARSRALRRLHAGWA
jgi:hypothetical protein